MGVNAPMMLLGLPVEHVIPYYISGQPITEVIQNAVYPGFTVAGHNGTAPYAYTVFAGTLPTGLSLNSSTGLVSGTPTVVQTKAGIVIRSTDANGVIADLTAFDIAVGSPVPSWFEPLAAGGATDAVWYEGQQAWLYQQLYTGTAYAALLGPHTDPTLLGPGGLLVPANGVPIPGRENLGLTTTNVVFPAGALAQKICAMDYCLVRQFSLITLNPAGSIVGFAYNQEQTIGFDSEIWGSIYGPTEPDPRSIYADSGFSDISYENPVKMLGLVQDGSTNKVVSDITAERTISAFNGGTAYTAANSGIAPFDPPTDEGLVALGCSFGVDGEETYFGFFPLNGAFLLDVFYPSGKTAAEVEALSA